MVGRTCIVIAHRLSTIRSVDRIILLKDGKMKLESRKSHAKENGMQNLCELNSGAMSKN